MLPSSDQLTLGGGMTEPLESFEGTRPVPGGDSPDDVYVLIGAVVLITLSGRR